jgi:hypothetical protein
MNKIRPFVTHEVMPWLRGELGEFDPTKPYASGGVLTGKSGRFGFDDGGLARLPRVERATRDSVLNSILAHFAKDPGYAHGQSHTMSLARLALTDDVMSRIPVGSEFLGSGIAGVALKTPQNEVIRLQSRRAADRALQKMFGLVPDVVSTHRPSIEGVLQPLASGLIGKGRKSVFMERLPLVQSVSQLSSRERHDVRSYLHQKMMDQGYRFTDHHDGNIGLLNGAPVILDPGAVTNLHPHVTSTVPGGFNVFASGGALTGKSKRMPLRRGFSGGGSGNLLPHHNLFTTDLLRPTKDGMLGIEYGGVNFTDFSRIGPRTPEGLLTTLGLAGSEEQAFFRHTTMSGDINDPSSSPGELLTTLGLVGSEKQALFRYTTMSEDINNPSAYPDEDFTPVIESIRSAINRNRLLKNTILYRGISRNSSERLLSSFGASSWFDDSVVGQEFSQDRFLSTSVNFPTALHFALLGKRGGSALRILAPAGSEAVDLLTTSVLPDQEEILLPKNSRFSVLGAMLDPRYPGIKLPFITAMLLGADASKMGAQARKPLATGGPLPTFQQYAANNLSVLQQWMDENQDVVNAHRSRDNGILRSLSLTNGIFSYVPSDVLEAQTFATGGVVPGVGYSDSVPMDLPVGSFVIRRNSAEQIGHDNLARLPGMASGGSKVDSIPAILTPQEYVFSPEESDRIGLDALHYMNSTGKVHPRLADRVLGKNGKYNLGGRVGLSTGDKTKDILRKLPPHLQSYLQSSDKSDEASYFQLLEKAALDNGLYEVSSAKDAEGRFIRTPETGALHDRVLKGLKKFKVPTESPDGPESLEAYQLAKLQAFLRRKLPTYAHSYRTDENRKRRRSGGNQPLNKALDMGDSTRSESSVDSEPIDYTARRDDAISRRSRAVKSTGPDDKDVSGIGPMLGNVLGLDADKIPTASELTPLRAPGAMLQKIVENLHNTIGDRIKDVPEEYREQFRQIFSNQKGKKQKPQQSLKSLVAMQDKVHEFFPGVMELAVESANSAVKELSASRLSVVGMTDQEVADALPGTVKLPKDGDMNLIRRQKLQQMFDEQKRNETRAVPRTKAARNVGETYSTGGDAADLAGESGTRKKVAPPTDVGGMSAMRLRVHVAQQLGLKMGDLSGKSKDDLLRMLGGSSPPGQTAGDGVSSSTEQQRLIPLPMAPGTFPLPMVSVPLPTGAGHPVPDAAVTPRSSGGSSITNKRKYIKPTNGDYVSDYLAEAGRTQSPYARTESISVIPRPAYLQPSSNEAEQKRLGGKDRERERLRAELRRQQDLQATRAAVSAAVPNAASLGGPIVPPTPPEDSQRAAITGQNSLVNRAEEQARLERARLLWQKPVPARAIEYPSHLTTALANRKLTYARNAATTQQAVSPVPDPSLTPALTTTPIPETDYLADHAIASETSDDYMDNRMEKGKRVSRRKGMKKEKRQRSQQKADKDKSWLRRQEVAFNGRRDFNSGPLDEIENPVPAPVLRRSYGIVPHPRRDEILRELERERAFQEHHAGLPQEFKDRNRQVPYAYEPWKPLETLHRGVAKRTNESRKVSGHARLTPSFHYAYSVGDAGPQRTASVPAGDLKQTRMLAQGWREKEIDDPKDPTGKRKIWVPGQSADVMREAEAGPIRGGGLNPKVAQRAIADRQEGRQIAEVATIQVRGFGEEADKLASQAQRKRAARDRMTNQELAPLVNEHELIAGYEGRKYDKHGLPITGTGKKVTPDRDEYLKYNQQQQSLLTNRIADLEAKRKDPATGQADKARAVYELSVANRQLKGLQERATALAGGASQEEVLAQVRQAMNPLLSERAGYAQQATGLDAQSASTRQQQKAARDAAIAGRAASRYARRTLAAGQDSSGTQLFGETQYPGAVAPEKMEDGRRGLSQKQVNRSVNRQRGRVAGGLSTDQKVAAVQAAIRNGNLDESVLNEVMNDASIGKATKARLAKQYMQAGGYVSPAVFSDTTTTADAARQSAGIAAAKGTNNRDPNADPASYRKTDTANTTPRRDHRGKPLPPPLPSAAQFRDSGRLTNTTFEKEVEDRARKEYEADNKRAADRNGGQLSEETRNKNIERARQRAARDVAAEARNAQARLLQSQNKNLSWHEATKMADEKLQLEQRAERARINKELEARGQAPLPMPPMGLIKDENGQILGEQKSTQAAINQGGKPPGAGGWGYRWGKFTSAVGRGWDVLQQKNQVYEDYLKSRGMSSGQMAFAGSMILPMVGQGVASMGGDAQIAAATGNEIGYKTAAGAGGLLTGAGVGAMVGSMIPGAGVVGVAAGAVIGGLLSMRSALLDAAKEIRDIKIGKALEQFSDKLAVMSQLQVLAPEGYTDTTRQHMQVARREIADKSYAASGWFAFSPTQYVANQEKNMREAMGPQVTAMTGYLQQRLGVLARDNPKLSVGEILEKSKGNPLDADLNRLVPQLRKISEGDFQQEQKAFVQSKLRALEMETAAKKDANAQQLQVAAFSRLAMSMDKAVSSLSRLQHSAESVASAFDGNFGSSRVSVNSGALDRLAIGDPQALKMLEMVRGIGGRDGGLLADQGLALSKVNAVLPSVLMSVASNVNGEGPNQEEAFQTQVSQQLVAFLGKDDPNVNRVIASVRAGLDREMTGERRMAGLHDSVGSDVSGLTSRLMGTAMGPVTQFGKQVVDKYLEYANTYSDLGERGRKQTLAIGESGDRGVDLQTQLLKLRSDISGERAGRLVSSQMDVPVETLLEPILGRERRLAVAGGVGPLADLNDHQAVGKRLQEVQSSILEQEERRKNLLMSGKNESKDFIQASTELEKLKTSATSLRQALESMANPVQKLTIIQERLAQLRSEEQGRISFGMGYLSSTPEERERTNIGILQGRMAIARNPEAPSLAGMMPEDQANVLRVFSQLGSSVLTGFPTASDGKPYTGTDFTNTLIKNTPGAGGPVFASDKNTAAERKRLQDEAIKTQEKAGAAQDTLTGNLKTLQESFFQRMAGLQGVFFAELKSMFAGNATRDMETQLGSAKQTSNRVQQGVKAREVLRDRFGIEKQEDFDAINGNQKLFDEYGQSVRTREDLREKFFTVTKRIRERREQVLAGANGKKDTDIEGIFPFLSNPLGNDFLPNDMGNRRGVIEDLLAGLPQEVIANMLQRSKEDIWDKTLSSEQRADALITGLGHEELRVEKQGEFKYNDIRNRVRSAMPQGFPLVPVTEGLRAKGGLDDFRKAQETITNMGGSFEKLATEAKKAQDEVTKLTDLLKNLLTQSEAPKLEKQTSIMGSVLGGLTGSPLGAAMGVVAAGSGFATGGIVGLHTGKPQGTDTVPAWLTHGEAVIPQQSVAGNRNLVDSLIAAKGPLYLAEGGVIDDYLPQSLWYKRGYSFKKQTGPQSPARILADELRAQSRLQAMSDVDNWGRFEGAQQAIGNINPRLTPASLEQMNLDARKKAAEARSGKGLVASQYTVGVNELANKLSPNRFWPAKTDAEARAILEVLRASKKLNDVQPGYQSEPIDVADFPWLFRDPNDMITARGSVFKMRAPAPDDFWNNPGGHWDTAAFKRNQANPNPWFPYGIGLATPNDLLAVAAQGLSYKPPRRPAPWRPIPDAPQAKPVVLNQRPDLEGAQQAALKKAKLFPENDRPSAMFPDSWQWDQIFNQGDRRFQSSDKTGPLVMAKVKDDLDRFNPVDGRGGPVAIRMFPEKPTSGQMFDRNLSASNQAWSNLPRAQGPALITDIHVQPDSGYASKTGPAYKIGGLDYTAPANYREINQLYEEALRDRQRGDNRQADQDEIKAAIQKRLAREGAKRGLNRPIEPLREKPLELPKNGPEVVKELPVPVGPEGIRELPKPLQRPEGLREMPLEVPVPDNKLPNIQETPEQRLLQARLDAAKKDLVAKNDALQLAKNQVTPFDEVAKRIHERMSGDNDFRNKPWFDGHPLEMMNELAKEVTEGLDVGELRNTLRGYMPFASAFQADFEDNPSIIAPIEARKQVLLETVLEAKKEFVEKSRAFQDAKRAQERVDSLMRQLSGIERLGAPVGRLRAIDGQKPPGASSVLPMGDGAGLLSGLSGISDMLKGVDWQNLSAALLQGESHSYWKNLKKPAKPEYDDSELRMRARINPFGTEGMLVRTKDLHNKFGDKIPAQEALKFANQNRQEELNLLQMRQFLAQSQNPLAAFGKSRADSASQRGIFDRQLVARGVNMQKATRGVGSEKDPVPFPVAAEFMRRGLKTQRQILPFHGLKVREPSWFEIGWNALTKFSRFAEGGLISGEPIPGLPGTDNIPGLLTKGEFVIPKPQVDRLGVPFLEGLRKFATGGLVSSGGVQAPVPSTGSGPGFSQEVIQAFSRASLGLQNAFTLFSNTTDALKMAMTTFNAAASELAKALASFTGKLEVTGQQQVNVVVSGDMALAKLLPTLQDLVKQMVTEQVRRLMKQSMPDVQLGPD